MPRKSVSDDVAFATMLARGVRPSIAYPGLNKPWPGICLTCGAETKSTYYNVAVKGLGGCQKCGARKRHENRATEYKNQALINIANSGFKPVEEFTNGRDAVLVKCLKCGEQKRVKANDLKSGKNLCRCQRVIKLRRNSVSIGQGMPELIHEWDFEANGDFTPQNTAENSHREIHWICEVGHTYKMSPELRKRGQGCPFCSGRRVMPGENDLATTHPKIAGQWNFERNGTITPTDVSKGSNVKVWWKCPNGHEYQSATNKRTSGRGCPICTNKLLVTGINDLATMYPDLTLEFHPFRNGELKASDVIAGSHTKLWWKCAEGHEWQATTISRINGRGCSSCASHGYKPNQPAILYFIQNDELMARKIGITNSETQNIRLTAFGRRGWDLIYEIRTDGAVIAELEKRILKQWIRTELGLPRYLGQEEMGAVGGWTETFSLDGPTNEEIIHRIVAELANLANPKSSQE